MHLTSRCVAFSILCVALAVFVPACGPSPSADDDAPPPADADLSKPVDAGPDAHLGVCGDGTKDPGEACDDGNAVDGDGCQVDCTATPTAEIQCETLAPIATGVCEVTAGNATKLFKGTVLTPGTVYRGGQVAVGTDGKIMCVGCDCAAQVAGATTITCPKGVISPGLINTHDHITFTQNPPYTQTSERYEQRHDWRKGIRGHTKIPSPGSATSDAMSWGELRFVMGGATSIVGSGGSLGFLRNLDRATQQEGLGKPAVDFQTFPLDDNAGMQHNSGCEYGAAPDTEATVTADSAYLPHVSEGIDDVSRNEFLCTSSASYDTTAPGISHVLTSSKSAFIHGIGLNAADYALMAATGTSLIWSPRSNITLYGNTATVTLADRLGVRIALGTDWMPTGSMNLLRELRCASDFNTTYLGGYFSDEDLWRMVTINAASVTAADDLLGVLAPGHLADIAIFDGSVNDSFKAVVAAEAADVTLVVRAGKPLYGDDALIAALATDCDTVDVCGTGKRVCAMGEVGKSLSALQTGAGNLYAAFFCTTPQNEPSCLPARGAAVTGSTVYTGAVSAMDTDGDGILDAADDCPSVFNPVRPLDSGTQANADGDTEGDACDVCPFDANTSACTVFNPDDSDGDGHPNTSDNCPNAANPDQHDSDSDGKGDVCDPCPGQANPGSEACTVSIYDIKKGIAATGANVGVKNALVTAKIPAGGSAKGLFLQVREGDAGYAGADFSGIFAFGDYAAVVGDRVDIASATIAVFNGEIELTTAVMTVTSSGNAAPAPVSVLPTEIATGGARAVALEGVLVKVDNVTVAALDAPVNEFVVDGALRVDDLLFLASPFPVVGQNFASVTGVLALRKNSSTTPAGTKVEPRNAADLVAGSAALTGFAPASSRVAVGALAAPTAPTPLTVTLSNAVASDTFVAISSGDAALTVVGGGVNVPAGQTSAPVLVNGVAQSAGVTLTATLGTTSLQASVRVVAADEQPVLVALTPPMATTTPGGTVNLTVALDLPAPAAGTQVALSLDPALAGTIPASVTVPAGQQTATFSYVDGSISALATVTATLGTAHFASAITLAAVTRGLVINEVDYDQPASDTAEYVEIFNASDAAVSLTGKSLYFVNGSNGTVYGSPIDLGPAGTLAAGGYLVIGPASVLATVPAGTLTISSSAAIQNGDPDGIALVDTVGLTIIDKLAYGGAINNAVIPNIGTVSLVEGTATSVKDTGTMVGSLIREPNGADSNNAMRDWAFSTTLTPGAANIP